ncbi:MAG: hypothetical protein KA059_00420 [Elusimicrobiales bacterium]|nr:hypothetical protein [Elusimicrobiales bacterium]
MTNEELKELIFNELINQVGKAFVKLPDTEFFMRIASDIAAQKELSEKSTSDEERQKIRTNIDHLQTQIMLRIESNKIKLARKGEMVLNNGIRFVIRKFIPWV